MVRFFFHIVGMPQRIEDPEGEDFDSLEVAQASATLAARELLTAHIQRGLGFEGYAIEIADANGVTKATIPFADCLRWGIGQRR